MKERRRLLVWCAITFAGSMGGLQLLGVGGLLGILATVFSFLLAIVGCVGMLWHLGQLQDQASRMQRHRPDKGANGA